MKKKKILTINATKHVSAFITYLYTIYIIMTIFLKEMLQNICSIRSIDFFKKVQFHFNNVTTKLFIYNFKVTKLMKDIFCSHFYKAKKSI